VNQVLRKYFKRKDTPILISCILSILIIFSITLWKVPQFQVSHAKVTEKERIVLENSLRATLAQILGGFFVFLGIYFTWKNVAVLEEKQITDRFNQAISHLGSEHLQIRLGGIYALERIARDSDKDYFQILEILTAYIRDRSKLNQSLSVIEPVHIDIQAILNILQKISNDSLNHKRTYCFDMSGTNLKQANISNAFLKKSNLSKASLDEANIQVSNLEGANLYKSSLVKADLFKANLKEVYLKQANCCKANFISANLDSAGLSEVNFENAKLAEASLKDSDLINSNLKNADLSRANLQSADLIAANVEGTNFSQTNLKGANLSDARGLTREQLKNAFLNKKTKLPSYLIGH